jgi:hypothetical protein
VRALAHPALARVPVTAQPAAPAPGAARRGEAAMSRKPLKAVVTDAETDEFSSVTSRTSRGGGSMDEHPQGFSFIAAKQRGY